MYILAFKDGHDPAACLLRDGEIVAAVEEERFVRVKHAPSYFPKHSIAYCLREAGISESDVTHVVYARLTMIPTFFAVVGYYLRRLPRTRVELHYALSHMKVQVRGAIAQMRGRAGYQQLQKEFPGLPAPVAPFDHHLCHAASAFLYSPFEESLVITWDGKGEATSLATGYGQGADLSILKRRGIFESLGLMYSAATAYLGFTPNDGEYKVMGLAPYGEAGVDISDLLKPTEGGYRVNSNYSLYPLTQKKFEKRFGPARERESEMTKEQRDLAYALQDSLEQVGIAVAKDAQGIKPSRHACFAGGVALNVKLNKVLLESGLFDDMWVQPAAGDNGLVLGAAGLMYSRLTGKRPAPLTHLYLGSSYSDVTIAQTLTKRGIRFTTSGNVSADAAKLIEEGNILAWFQGRMEFGPRSLGGRSVLAHPGLPGMREHINEKIKFREEFRPFCPSILEEHASEVLEKAVPSPFMILSFDATAKAKELMSAVVHVDGTVRPQTVGKNGSRYRQLLEEVYTRTGVPGVLNTSLNIRGEPIVESPDHLVDFFLKTNVDAIVGGNCIALRSEQDPKLFETLSRDTLKTEY